MKRQPGNTSRIVYISACCYDYGENVSEPVEKIAAVEKDYHKCSFYVIVCCIATSYHQ